MSVHRTSCSDALAPSHFSHYLIILIRASSFTNTIDYELRTVPSAANSKRRAAYFATIFFSELNQANCTQNLLVAMLIADRGKISDVCLAASP